MSVHVSQPVLAVLAVVAATCLTAAALFAQTTPPPPSGPAPAPAIEPAPAPKPPSALDDLRRDANDQSAISDIDKDIDRVRTLVSQAREAALKFHVARGKLNDIIAAGKCGGVPSVLQSIARQETETRRLAAILNDSCKEPTGPSLTKVCGEERKKLNSELAAYDEDRESLRKMCPGNVN